MVKDNGKLVVVIGAAFVLLGVGLGFLLDAFAIWYYQQTTTIGSIKTVVKLSLLPLNVAKGEGSGSIGGFSILGSTEETNTMLMVVYILILLGGVVSLVGAAGNKKITLVGVLVVIVALVVFAAALPSILEDLDVTLSKDNIYTTYNATDTLMGITTVTTQVLWLRW
ncbi:MAG: hypothetical protein ACTSU5_06805 [Promethearchaeota archaeon]